MSLVVIALCFAVQWFFHFNSVPYQKQWVPHYIGWMRKTFSSLMQGHGLFTLLVLVLPILIGVSVLFAVVYHVLGQLGYFILSVALLWYLVDITPLRSSTPAFASVDEFLLHAYRKIFSPVFWFFVLGPVGLILTVVVHELSREFPTQKDFTLATNVVDWLPVRVLGLTFALAGNFSTVFKLWLKEALRPISQEENQVIVLAHAAMRSDATKSASFGDVVGLIDRTVLIWLIIIALLSIGGWIG